ncbi:MAG: type II toxin-antitoxin system antitoxin DNA ADP-ribosyl glycohydrolase DarG [Pseudohongiellaceae bacterium]
MIKYKTGNIVAEDAEAIVNTVNCIGVMGRGIALQFKKAFPQNFEAYTVACKNEEVKPGRMFIYDTGGLTNPKYIINFPTKQHWKENSRMEYIESGLEALRKEIMKRQIHSIAIPPLGCGLGGLDWATVKQHIERALAGLEDVQILVFEPKGSPDADKMARSQKVPNMTPGRAVLVALMHRYLTGLLDPFITLLELHKLMYFMQEAGEPLRLEFQQASYGPYAENLRHVLNAVEGYMISGYADGTDAPDKPLELVPGVKKDADAFLDEHAKTKARFEQVAKLVDGFESSFGLELLSTVHWVMKHEKPGTKDDIVNRVYAWNERKRQFTPRQILLARDVLVNNSWLGLH